MLINNVLSMHDLQLLIDNRVKANEFTYQGSDTEFTLSVIHDNTTIIAIEANCNADTQIEACAEGGHYSEYHFSEVNITGVKYQSMFNKHTALHQTNPVDLASLSEHVRDILNSAGLYDFYDEDGEHIEFSNMYSPA